MFYISLVITSCLLTSYACAKEVRANAYQSKVGLKKEIGPLNAGQVAANYDA